MGEAHAGYEVAYGPQALCPVGGSGLGFGFGSGWGLGLWLSNVS